MNLKSWLIFILFLQGCFPSFREERLYLMEIEKSDLKLEWFFNASIGRESSDYLIATQNEIVDTICTSDNLEYIEVTKNNEIIISFNGTPSEYSKKIIIPNSVFNYSIMIDTISYKHNEVKHRPIYRKKCN